MVKYIDINTCFDFIKKKNSQLGINFGLERISQTLQKLNNPQNNYPTIHITGTNGKGSTTMMISSILQSFDFKVGTYTSPKIHTYNEMFLINGKQISDDDFIKNFNEIINFCDHLTAFEILTVLAFHFFDKEKVDYAVIEVGCGGLLDATNVITPIATVITNITNDHENILNNVIKHKLGIIKKNIPLITTVKNEGILNQIYQLLPKEKVSIYEKDFNTKGISIDEDRQIVNYSDKNGNFNFEIKLFGDFQIENSALAIRTIFEILSKSDIKLIQTGLIKAKIHYRFEKINFKDKTFILDGAHNTAGISALKKSLYKYFPREKKTVIIGILKDKNYKDMLDDIIEEEDSVIIVKPYSERACDTNVLFNLVNCTDKNIANSYENAIDKALEMHNKLIVITGTFFNEDIPRRYIEKKKYIEKK